MGFGASPQKAPSNSIILVRYALCLRILELLERIALGVGGEIWLTVVLKELLANQGLNSVETHAKLADFG